MTDFNTRGNEGEPYTWVIPFYLIQFNYFRALYTISNGVNE